MPDTLSVLVARLGAKPVGSSFRAPCPAHDDSTPSLTFRRGDDVPIVLRCHAGCPTESILAAAGLPEDFLSREEADEPAAAAAGSSERQTRSSRSSSSPAIIRATTRYVVADPSGTPVAIHLRHDLMDGGKRMAWIWADGSSSTPDHPIRPSELPLYRSETLNGRAPYVFVTEGEKAADALAELVEMPALGTVTGAASLPSPSSLEPLRDRTVVLWPDNDPAGIEHMRGLARSLRGVAERVVTLDVSTLPPKGDAADYPGDRNDVLGMVSEAEHSAAASADDRVQGTVKPRTSTETADAVSEADLFPALAPGAFHGVAGEIVRAIEPYTEADPAGILVSLLTMAGVALGRYRVLSTAGAGVQAPNLFTMLVGESATGRKGTAVGVARTVMEMAEPEFPKIALAGLGSGEGLIEHLRREIDRAAKANDVAEYRVLVDESEMVRLLTAMGREGSTISAILRAAFDGTPMGRATVLSNSSITFHHVGLLGQVTPGELRTKMQLSDRANGFANRFLWVAVRQRRLVPFAGHPRQYVDNVLVDDLAGALANAGTIAPLTLSPASEDVWRELYAEIVAEQRSRIEGFAMLTSREITQTLRIASIYALLDRGVIVRPEHIEAARAITAYSLASARWVWQMTTGDAEADALYNGLRVEGEIAWMDLRRDYGLRGAEAEQTVDTLVRAGLAEVVTVTTRGRPRRVVRLVEELS